MATAEQYLRPDVIQQVKRLDLRAKFIVQGFLSGLHRSPFHGFSAEFSEHRKYSPGDDLALIDWNVFARTDRYYIKKFQAETNLTGYLLMDLSASMDYTASEELTKLDYAISLAAALAYLMVYQSDAVGMITFDDRVQTYLPPKSRRTQIGAILSSLTRINPSRASDFASAMHEASSLIRHQSLLMIFSDLLPPEDEDSDIDEHLRSITQALIQLRQNKNDVILFHILDAAEVHFPFKGLVEFVGKETERSLVVQSEGIRADYLEAIADFQDQIRRQCALSQIDYVPLHTGLAFDKALMEYLVNRRRR